MTGTRTHPNDGYADDPKPNEANRKLKAVDAVCRVLCKSGRFETGQGTCAPLCMDQLGDARQGCPHHIMIFGSLAVSILTALE